jgi:hypothetical protein
MTTRSPLLEQLDPVAVRGALRVPRRLAGLRRVSVGSLLRVVPAGVVILVVLLWAAAPGLFTHVDPDLAVPAVKLQAPSAAHLLGTDYLGRDMLSRSWGPSSRWRSAWWRDRSSGSSPGPPAASWTPS